MELKHRALETTAGAEPGHLQSPVALRGAATGRPLWRRELLPALSVGGDVEGEVVGGGEIGQGVRRRGDLVAEDGVGFGGIGSGVGVVGEKGNEGFVEEARAPFHRTSFETPGDTGRDGQGGVKSAARDLWVVASMAAEIFLI